MSSGEHAPAEPFIEPPDDIREFWRIWMTTRDVPVGSTTGFRLVAPPSRPELLGLPASAEHPHLPLQRPEGGPPGRDAPHRPLPRDRRSGGEVADAQRTRRRFAAMKRDTALLGPEMGAIFEVALDATSLQGDQTDAGATCSRAEDLRLRRGGGAVRSLPICSAGSSGGESPAWPRSDWRCDPRLAPSEGRRPVTAN